MARLTGISLDENLLLALVTVESGGRPDAQSASGAVGLTQVEPATFQDLQLRDGGALRMGSLRDPRVNLLAGALYLADCAEQVDASVTRPEQLHLVLYAYNLVPRAAVEWRDTGTCLKQAEHGGHLEHELPVETVEQAARIMSICTTRPDW